MANLPKNKSRIRFSLLISILVHLGLIAALVVTIPHTSYRWHSSVKSKPIVNAEAVDAKELSEQIKQIRWEQGEKERQERARLQKIKRRAQLAAKQRIDEQQRLQELKNKQEAEQKRMQALQAKQAEELKLQVQQEKKVASRLQKLQKEVKNLHQQALNAKQSQLQRQLLEQQMQNEQARLKREKEKLEKIHNVQLKGIMDKYRAQMLQIIQENWHPLLQDAKLSCLMLVHLAPGGVVTSVDLLKSSGNAALDRSARLAIIKSSPLPVPSDPALFENFREVRIKMVPQEVKGLS